MSLEPAPESIHDERVAAQVQAAMRYRMGKRQRNHLEAALRLLSTPETPDLCLREVVVTSDTVCDPAWLAATHVLCMRPLPCNNPNHKPNAGWASA